MLITRNIPIEVLLAAAERAAEREKYLASTQLELSETLSRLSDERRREIGSVIGGKKFERYEKARKETKERLAELTRSTRHNTESLARASQEREQILNDAKQYLVRMKIDATRVEEVKKKYEVAARSAIGRAFRADEEAPYVDAGLDDVPMRSHNTLHSRSAWEWKSPPYDDEWGQSWTVGWLWGRHFTNKFTGELYSACSLSVTNPHDGAYYGGLAHSEFRFWFQVPATGLIEVWMYLQAINNFYNGTLIDEWGFTSAHVYQQCQPYFWTEDGYSNVRYTTVLDYQQGHEGSWSGTIAAPGEYRYPHLFSLHAYAAGQWIKCGAGVKVINLALLDDMSCYLALESSWLLTGVAIRSTGG